MAHTLAYFAFDQVAETYYNTNDSVMTFHHSIAFICITPHFFHQYSGFESSVLHFIAESSNLWLAFRTILKVAGWKTSKLYFFNDLIFAINFFLARMISSPLGLYLLYEGNNILWVDRLSVGAIIFLSTHWGLIITF